MSGYGISPVFNEATLNNSGDPASGWKLYFYLGGGSTPYTPKKNSAGSSSHSVPIVLNARGEPSDPIWLLYGQSYRAVLKTDAGVTVREFDLFYAVNDPQTSVSHGITQVHNLVATPNTTNPTYQMDISVAYATISNSSGYTALVTPSGTMTLNIATAGPVANGRDKSGNFVAGNWIHVWLIYNGTTVATLASTSATAPTLPAGYTHKALLFALYANGTNTFAYMVQRGTHSSFVPRLTIVNAGSATTQTALPIQPPAGAVMAIYQAITVGYATPPGNTRVDVDFRTISGIVGSVYAHGGYVYSVNPLVMSATVHIPIPSGGTVYYLGTILAGTSYQVYIYLTGLVWDNGAVSP